MTSLWLMDETRAARDSFAVGEAVLVVHRRAVRMKPACVVLAVLLGGSAGSADPANIVPTQGASVAMTWEEVAGKALAALTAEERRSGVLYLDRRELPAGSTLTVDNREIPLRRRSAVAFVDKVPQANWGHPSRYLLIDLDNGGIESIDAQFPPFLRSVPPTLQTVFKGPAVPDWAVVRP
jgi:hypothetical protein